MERESLRHSLQLVYGRPTERPAGHERCVVCDGYFGAGVQTVPKDHDPLSVTYRIVWPGEWATP